MTNILRFFGLLDILSIALLSRQVFNILIHADQVPDNALSIIRSILLVLIFILLFISAYSLFTVKKLGAIIYYIQFPLRLIVWVFSFGFITLLDQYNLGSDLFDWLFRMAFVLEFFRLFYTIRIHRQLWT